MTDSELEACVAAAEAAADAAGAAIRPYFRSGLPADQKSDESPVTAADRAAERAARGALAARCPDHGILGEEFGLHQAGARWRWVVDPIDGTRAYVSRKPWFVVALAIVEDGIPVAAAIYAPALDELYEAEAGSGATLNGAPIAAAATATLEASSVLADPRLFSHYDWAEPWPALDVQQRNAIAYRMALVAAGRFDSALSLTPKHEWDVAAGSLIAEEAGASVTDHLGQPLRFNSPRALCPSLVCAAPALAPLILARTRPIQRPI